jgi:hypothetical protein
MKTGDLQRLIDLLAAQANEGTMAVNEQRAEDGSPELFLTIENTVEDRVRAYTRLLRKSNVLRKSRGG